MYTTYTTNFNKAMTLLNQTQSNSMGFINVLDYLRDLPLCENLELGSFLILPVQRIPRYVLLLTDLISNTANTHEDYSLLNESLTLMKTVADELDYAIQDEENRNKCFEIQKLLGNSIQIVEAYRRLIHEGELYKQCRKDRKLRKFWLFNDMMICGFFQPTLLRYQHRKIELSTLAISDIPDDPEKNILNAIEISDYSKSFLVYTKTFDEKVNWLVILQNSIVEYKKKKKTLITEETTDTNGPVIKAPVWIPDENAECCHLCLKKFHLLRRKHHCRVCGYVICEQCSENKLLVQNISRNKVRVCNDCFVKNIGLAT